MPISARPDPDSMNFCFACMNENELGSVFCEECGSVIDSSQNPYQKDIESNIARLRSFIADNPEHGKSYYYLGRYLEEQGKKEQAVVQFRMAVEKGNVRALKSLMKVSMETDQSEQLLYSSKYALKYMPDSYEVHQALDLTYRLLDFDERAKTEREYCEKRKNISYGIEAYRKQLYLQAIRYLNIADKEFPGNQDVHYYLFVSYLQLRNYSDMKKEYDQLSDFNKGRMGHFVKGLLHFSTGDHKEALAEFTGSYDLNKNSKITNFYIGALHYLKDDKKQAAAAYLKGQAAYEKGYYVNDEIFKYRNDMKQNMQQYLSGKVPAKASVPSVSGAPADSNTGQAADKGRKSNGMTERSSVKKAVVSAPADDAKAAPKTRKRKKPGKKMFVIFIILFVAGLAGGLVYMYRLFQIVLDSFN